MKYIINKDFDKIDNDNNKTILFTGVVENVYILNEIETKIWELFTQSCEINEAYAKFNSIEPKVSVKKEDFYDFVEQLISKRILILSND
ncbi:MAG: hypothetical protein IKB41_00885 [Clostridia bacterium]|nr:hypothetical protein [Clostridia bacterium]